MEGNILLLLRQLNISLEQYGREQMKNLKLSPSQRLTLDYLLSRKGDTVYATDLHRQFGISKSAISATLKGLKKQGYLDMLINPEDDRKKQIVLTSKAYAAEQQINAGVEEQQNRLCREIPREHLKILEEGLQTMIRNMKKEPRRSDGHDKNTVGTGTRI